ncbi:MAG: response regulator, partial [Oscillospiraceae bacterium]|nr:response regulator [Oscillospiraceae bacterium]
MRALIVDDEPLALECALAMIDWAAEGVRHVDTARSAAQAKAPLARDGADILLCDIEMPGGSGLELVEWVRRQDITAQVILLTAHGDFSYAQRAVGLGCLGYLLKPIDPEELRESLRGAIQIVRQQRSYARYREDSERWLRNKPVMAELFWQK